MPKKKQDEDDAFGEDQHASFMDTIAATRAAQDQAAKRMEDAMMNQLKIAKDKVKKLKELEDQHKQNEDDLIAARAELKEQELVIEALKKENASLEERLKRALEDAKEKEEIGRKAQDEARTLTGERDILIREKESHLREIERLKERAEQAEKDNVQHQLEAERAKGEANTLQERVQSLQSTVNQVAEKAETESADLEKIKQLTQQVNDLTTERAALQERLHDNEKQVVVLESDMKHKDSKITDQDSEIKRLLSEIEDLKIQLRSAQQESKELKSAPPPVVKNNEAEDALKEMTRKRDEAVEELKQERDNVMKVNVELADSKAENRFQKETILKLEKEVETLKEELAKVRDELTQLRAQKETHEATAQSEKEARHKEREDNEKARRDLEQDIQEKQRAIDELQKEKATREEEDAKKAEKAKKYQTHRGMEFDEDDEVAARSAHAAAVEADKAAADAAKLRLQSELLDAVRKQVAIAEEELEAGLRELATKDEEWAALNRELRIAESKIAGLQQQVLSLTETKANGEADKAELQQNLAELREEVAVLTVKNTHVEAKRAEAEALADERTREIARLHDLLKSQPATRTVVTAPSPEGHTGSSSVTINQVQAFPENSEAKSGADHANPPQPELDFTSVLTQDGTASLSAVDISEEEDSPDDDSFSPDEEEEDSDESGVDGDFEVVRHPVRPTRGAYFAIGGGGRARSEGAQPRRHQDEQIHFRGRVVDREFRADHNAGGVKYVRRAHADYYDEVYDRQDRVVRGPKSRSRPTGHVETVTIPVLLRPSKSSSRLNLVGQGNLRISREGVTFEKEGGQTVHWPLRVIKKYGDDIELFSIEVGSISETGRGVFFFQTERWKDAFRALNKAMVDLHEQQLRR